jgi:hypothetical protein
MDLNGTELQIICKTILQKASANHPETTQNTAGKRHGFRFSSKPYIDALFFNAQHRIAIRRLHHL